MHILHSARSWSHCIFTLESHNSTNELILYVNNTNFIESLIPNSIDCRLKIYASSQYGQATKATKATSLKRQK